MCDPFTQLDTVASQLVSHLQHLYALKDRFEGKVLLSLALQLGCFETETGHAA